MKVLNYEELLERIRVFENKKKLALEGGFGIKARKIDHVLNDLYLRKERMEREMPADAIKTLEEELKKKDDAIVSLNTRNRELQDRIDEVNKRIEDLKKPTAPAENNPEKNDLVECPQCGRKFKRAGLKNHLRTCKSGKQ